MDASSPSDLYPLSKSPLVRFVLRFFLLLFVLNYSQNLLAQNTDVVVARVGNRHITQRELDDSVVGKLLPLQQQIYAVRKVALQNLITRKLLEDEASRKGITVDELRQQFMAGPVNVTSAQVDDLYQQNINVFSLFSPDEAKEKLRLDLEGQARLKRFREAIAALKQATPVEVLLTEPRLLLTSNQSGPSQGPGEARVVITEFADFQCGYCKEVQPTLKTLLRLYPNDIRLNFKNLTSVSHSLSQASAEAALCAGKQGRFWEFHDALFQSNGLSADVFDNLALKLRLDLNEFRQCLSSGEMRKSIEADLLEAQRLGINATPTFVINGRFLTGAATLKEFKAVIDQELLRSNAGSQN